MTPTASDRIGSLLLDAVHNARIEGGVASGTVHAVLAREAGVQDDLWVNVEGVPDWVQVNATIKELGDSSVVDRARRDPTNASWRRSMRR